MIGYEKVDLMFDSYVILIDAKEGKEAFALENELIAAVDNVSYKHM